MPLLNTATIEVVVQNKINSLSTASTINELLLPMDISNVGISAESWVNDRVDLPDLATSGIVDGHVIFVNSIKMHVVASKGQWIVFDGRVYRKDIPFKLLWSWGCNNLGQLGDNTKVSRSSPVSVVGGFLDWCQISAGGCHTAAVRTNGTLWAWGINGCGRLGDNTTINKSSPVSVVGGFSDWCQVSAGTYHTAAIRTNGTIWTWGCNGNGQIGDDTSVNKSSPVSVVGGFVDWCQVSAGGYHTAAVRTNGTIWTWGRNTSGQLGDNTNVSKSSPVSVVGGFSDWCQVSASTIHTAAVRINGTLWTWGYNGQGRLGDNTIVAKTSPVSVVGGFTDWCQVSAGNQHTAAVRTTGSLWTWGNNGQGRLGDNCFLSQLSPVSVVGGFLDWSQVSASNEHTAAIRTNGSIWAWGSNNLGQLGDNTTVSKSSPVSVVGGFTDWFQVSAGRTHTAAIRVIP